MNKKAQDKQIKTTAIVHKKKASDRTRAVLPLDEATLAAAASIQERELKRNAPRSVEEYDEWE